MPKLEPKQIQKELDQGQIRPFYWIYGPEGLKTRELLKRIRKAVLGTPGTQGDPSAPWGESSFDGSSDEVDGYTICDSARSPMLGSSIQLILVRDAHLLKNPEPLMELVGPPKAQSELLSVCVCLAKDLDGRKKFSKTLLDKAAVVACEEVTEAQREAWILYLAKRQGVQVDPSQIGKLANLEPWSLDLIANELEKYSISDSQSDAFLQDSLNWGGADSFVENFFCKNGPTALSQVTHFANHPDEALPLLGLLGWNVKQLANTWGENFKPNSFLAQRLKRWCPHWSLEEIVDLQNELYLLDLAFKQTPLLPLGLWSSLVQRFCE